MCFTLQRRYLASVTTYYLNRKKAILHIFRKYLIRTSTFIFVLLSHLFYFLCILILKFLDFCSVLLTARQNVLLYFIHGLFVSLLDTFAFIRQKLSPLLRIILDFEHLIYVCMCMIVSFIKQKIIQHIDFLLTL